ncbi:MAG: hypothetical protein FWE25_05155 [Lachnospiraceae bacterium]|nr:hypothetical protein [Lachnospiraceae bacterium]
MKTKSFEISNTFLGGYKKKDVDAYCNHLKDLLEDTTDKYEDLQQRYNQILEERALLENQLDKAEIAYRGLWEKSKVLEDTINKQHYYFLQATTSNKKQPFKNLYKQLERFRKLPIGLPQLGGVNEDG